jgi:hypothetical protein
MGRRIIISEHVIWRRIGDDIVVIKDDGLSTHVLNKTAACIWEMCDGKAGIDEITTRLCDRFEVSFEQARADVSDTVKKLTEASVIKYV